MTFLNFPKTLFLLCQHTNNFLLKLTLCCVDTSFRSWYNTWEKSNKSLKHKVEYLRASPKALHRLSRIGIRLNNIFVFCFTNTKCWADVFIWHKNDLFIKKDLHLHQLQFKELLSNIQDILFLNYHVIISRRLLYNSIGYYKGGRLHF